MKRGLFSRTLTWLRKVCESEYNRIIRFADRRRAVAAALFALLGVLCASAGFKVALAGCIVSTVICATVFIAKCKSCLRLTAFLLVFCAFSAWYLIRDIRPSVLPEGKHTVTGVICADPIEQSDDRRTVYTLSNVTYGNSKLTGKIRLYVYSIELEYEYGDKLLIQNCKLSVADHATNPDGFDFNAYLWKNHVSMTASASADNIAIVEAHASLKRGLLRLRAYLCEVCDSVFSESSDVMRAVLLGDRSTLDESVYNDFSDTGISHIIALSGLHVSAIALMLDWILKKCRLPRLARHIITVIFLVLYTDMTGSAPSTIRAVLMYAIGCAGTETGYPTDTLTRLALAFLIQLGVNPLLIGDNGFILSYIAIFAILSFDDIVPKTAKGKLSGLISTGKASFSVQAVSFPLLAGMFSSVPLLSVPVNILCVPFAILALYTGVVVLCMGCVSVPAARIAAYPCRLIWKYIKAVCAYAAKLPFASVITGSWPALLIGVYLAIAAMSSLYLSASRSRRTAGLTVMFLIAVFTLLPEKPIDHLRITCLDAGYADSAVINAKGHTYLLDCGKDNGISADYLISRGTSLAGIFVTHPDSDHAGGLNEVLHRYPRAKIYLPGCWDELERSAETDFLLYGRDVTYLYKGDTVVLAEGITAEVLWPAEDYTPDSDNNGCLVLNLTYADTSFLFMADLTDEHDFEASCDTDILKVAHHGSKYATTPEMLSIATPSYAVISVGGNGFGHPTDEVLTRLANIGCTVYRTDLCGAVTTDIYSGGTYKIATYLKRSEEE